MITRMMSLVFSENPVVLLDFVFALLGLIFFSPAMLVIAVIVWIKLGSPVIFVQKRPGLHEKIFKMYKFRTMVVGADEKLVEILEQDSAARKEFKKYKKLKEDPRITKAGKLLRKTSLDEFPQFINVLKGEMSLVGPRPYLFREHADMEGYYDIIVKHKPGITGLWQVSGRSDIEDFEKVVDLDMQYIRNWSIALDIKILFKK